MSRLRCRLETLWETLTMRAFWESLVRPPLVVMSGHVWPYPPIWSEPRLREVDGETLLVEVDLSACERCRYREDGWRPIYGTVTEADPFAHHVAGST